MDIQETLAEIRTNFSDPSVSQRQFEQLQRDKAVAAAKIQYELKQLAEKHKVPISDVEDLMAEVSAIVENLTIEVEIGYVEEIGCRLDCVQS